MYFTTHSSRDDPILGFTDDPNQPKGINKIKLKLRDVLI
jgi:hypothetical protein